MENKNYFEIIEGIYGKQRNFIFFEGYKITTNNFDTQVIGDYYLLRNNDVAIRFDDNNNERGKINFVDVKKSGIKQTMLNGKCLIFFYDDLQLCFILTEEAKEAIEKLSA